jgi:hypothetical protein
MARNQVQFQKGISLPEFIKQFGTEEQCHDALFKWRWPNGFKCPQCGTAVTALSPLELYINATAVIGRHQ